jgi:3-(3-hydroxy-phenyl)propionate hydroxylase
VAVSATSVLIVGAGPTGLAAANVLGRLGVETIIVERDRSVASEPRAVSIDDEAMRLLQSLGLAEDAAPVVRPGTGTRYYGAGGRLLAAASTPTPPAFGHPLKNPIDHGAFTRLLLDGLAAQPSVTVRFGHELVGLDAAGDDVGAVVRSPAGGEERIDAQWVLGCDGGRSATRKLLGIEMAGRSLEEPWLVIDTCDDPHAERYAMHHGDPARPHVVLPYGDGRCRYEFLLLPGEDEATATSFAMAQRLLATHRPDLRPEHVLRQRVYVFHALLATTWRRGRAFLLGDAAHMMPPFAGQGLNSGLKDAANLAWKLAAVARGELEERALDSYEQERRRHAAQMIDLSVRRGRVVMTTSRPRAHLRDAAALLARRLPALRRRLDTLPVKPPARHEQGLVVRGGAAIAGAMLPQPRVLLADGRLAPLDDVLGPWFALLAVEPSEGALRSPVWTTIGARRLRVVLDDRFPPSTAAHEVPVVADADGLLRDALADCRGQVVVVRPDRFVLGAFAPEREQDFLDQWHRLGGPVIDARAAQDGRVPTPVRSTT